MICDDHKFSVPLNFLGHGHDDSNANHGFLSGTRWYRHLVAPRIPTGLWIRQIVEQSDDYLIRIMNQAMIIAGESCTGSCCMILCGGGYDILLLQNDTPCPDHVDHIPMVGISLCLTSEMLSPHPDDNSLDEYGIVDPIDDLYLHMRAAVKMGVFPGNFRIYLRASVNCPVYQDYTVKKKIILRIENRTNNNTVVKTLRIHHKDAPKHVFSYQYDTWGIPISKPGAEPKSIVAKKQNTPLSTVTVQQPSRKRARTESSETLHKKDIEAKKKKVQSLIEPKTGKGQRKEANQRSGVQVANISTTNEPKQGEAKEVQVNRKKADVDGKLVTKKGSRIAGKESANVASKSDVPTILKNSDGSSLTAAGVVADQTKMNEKNKVTKVKAVSKTLSSKKVDDTSAKTMANKSTPDVVRKLPSSENSNKNKGFNDNDGARANNHEKNDGKSENDLQKATGSNASISLTATGVVADQKKMNGKNKVTKVKAVSKTMSSKKVDDTNAKTVANKSTSDVVSKLPSSENSNKNKGFNDNDGARGNNHEKNVGKSEKGLQKARVSNARQEPHKVHTETTITSNTNADTTSTVTHGTIGNPLGSEDSKITAKKRVKGAGKSGIVPAVKKSIGLEKASEKQNDAKVTVASNTISEKEDDINDTADVTTKGSSVSVETKTVMSQNSNKKKGPGKDKDANIEKADTLDSGKANVDSSIVKKKECFYYPFCQMTADVCGGTQRGRCREVKSGRVNVAPDIDRKELAKMKREAKQKQP